MAKSKPVLSINKKDKSRKVEFPNDEAKSTALTLTSGEYQVSRKDGVRALNDDGKKNKVCSYLTYKANLENVKTGKVSVLCEFIDHQRKAKEIQIPREDFNKTERVIERLTSHGFCIYDQKQAKVFISEFYLSNPPPLNISVVNEPGWHESGVTEKYVYAINGKTFSPNNEACNIVLDEKVNAGFSSKGSNEQWQQNIATFCEGNARLILLICASLLGPLLMLLGIQNVGLHIFGASKSAKTTCLIIARSIFGDQFFSFSWNATTAALQETASSRNDSVLFLDEISQGEEKHVAASAYSLLNGINKNRLSPDCKLNSVSHTQLVVISTGEYSLQDHLHQGGIKAKPGQLVRLPSVPIHPTKGMFSNLHGEASIGAIASKLRASVAENYGTIGQNWIQHLVDEQSRLKLILPDRMNDIQAALLTSIDVDQPTEAQRDVAKSMAAIACAGEEAIHCGLMPWPEGTATKAATTCFKAWYRHDTGEATKRIPFPSLRKYFHDHQDEFLSLEKFTQNGDSSIYTHHSDGIDVFLVPLKKSSDTIFKKFGEKDVLSELDKRDLLVRGCNNRPTKQFKIPTSKLPRQSFYVIRRSILATK